MRILVITSSYPTGTESIASAFLRDWVETLCVRGHTVTVVVPCDRHGPTNDVSDGQSTVAWVQYLPRPAWQTLAFGAGMYDNVRRGPHRLLQLAPLMAGLYARGRRLAGGSDLLHAHWLFPAGVVGALIKRATGIPLVLSIHSTDFHLLRSIPGGRALARETVRMADRLHFVTEYHRRAFTAWLGWTALDVPSYVAPMGVPDAMARCPSRPLRSRPRIGFLGRLIDLKGVDRLLEACAKLGRHEVRIAGDGPARAALVQLAHRLGIGATFVGPVAGRAKIAFLDSCDLVAVPSRQYASGRGEGLPVSMLEALVRGRVVIASNSGGIPEVVLHGRNGYLFSEEPGLGLEDVLRTVVDSWARARDVGTQAALTGRALTASVLAPRHEAAYRASVRHRLDGAGL